MSSTYINIYTIPPIHHDKLRDRMALWQVLRASFVVICHAIELSPIATAKLTITAQVSIGAMLPVKWYYYC